MTKQYRLGSSLEIPRCTWQNGGERHDVLRPVHEQRKRSPRPASRWKRIAPKQSMIERSGGSSWARYEAEVDPLLLS